MRALKIIGIVFCVYVGIVFAFESLIGFLQPANESTLVITTRDADGAPHDRVVSRLESEDRLYVAANHWPRAWYRQAVANPEVEVRFGEETKSYRAVPATEAEHVRVHTENDPGLLFRILTGFPPRKFLRLDPA